MVDIVNQTHRRQKTGIGKPNKLTTENQVLMTLEYLREYRTYFHIAQSWGVNESTASSDYPQNRRLFDCFRGI